MRNSSVVFLSHLGLGNKSLCKKSWIHEIKISCMTREEMTTTATVSFNIAKDKEISYIADTFMVLNT